MFVSSTFIQSERDVKLNVKKIKNLVFIVNINLLQELIFRYMDLFCDVSLKAKNFRFSS